MRSLPVSGIFVFKQKTSYELRISDWSSDVCSSDLRDRAIQMSAFGRVSYRSLSDVGREQDIEARFARGLWAIGDAPPPGHQIVRAIRSRMTSFEPPAMRM